MSAQHALFEALYVSPDKVNRDCWATPPAFVRGVAARLRVTFALDVCCFAHTAKAPHFFTAAEDGLVQPWSGVAWCNPPFSKGGSEWNGHQGIAAWAMKARHEADAGCAQTCLLAPSDLRTDDRKALCGCDVRVSVLRRVHFLPPPGVKKSSPNFGVDLYLFGEWPNPPKYL